MSTQPVCPVRIGATTRPSPALVLIYTRGLKSQDLRKRIMPLRQLGTLGVEAAARKMVEAHSEYLSPEKISFEIVRPVAWPCSSSGNAGTRAEPPAAAKEETKAEAKRPRARRLLPARKSRRRPALRFPSPPPTSRASRASLPYP